MKNMLVVSILGAVALAGGIGLVITADHYGWLRPGSETQAVTAGQCRHEIADQRCPFCHPELVESMGWCTRHDVAEALCSHCSPSIIPAFKVEKDWCQQHGLPESQCAVCRAGSTNTVASATTDGDDVMRANRPPSKTCTTAYSTVRLKSPEIARRVGLRVQRVRTSAVQETVSCNATVAFDGGRYAHLASRTPGIVAEVRVDLGEQVEAGDVLVVVDSSELGSAKAAYLRGRSLASLWEKNHARELHLFEKNVGTEKDVLEAQTRLVESRVQLGSAKQKLMNLGLGDEDLTKVLADDDTSSRLPLRAPFAGVVVERHAVVSEVVAMSRTLFAVADTRTMWVMLDLYENDITRIAKGQPVSMTIDAMPKRTFDGVLTWISAKVDPRTRTIQARAEAENPEGLLRANMFGEAEVHVREIKDAILVPESAVQWDGCCNVVFVRHTETVYQPYPVTLGFKRDGYFVVEDGLPAGESVVTQGSFLLKTEILKGNIGAGCCEVDPGVNE